MGTRDANTIIETPKICPFSQSYLHVSTNFSCLFWCQKVSNSRFAGCFMGVFHLFLESWVTHRPLEHEADGWLGMPGWVRRSTCFAAEMRYCNKRFAELGLGKLRQQTFRHNRTGMMVLQVGLRNSGLQMDLYLSITSYYITIERGIGFHRLFSNSIMCKKHWCRFRMPC